VVTWGSTCVVIKGVLDDVGPLTLALARFAVVLALLVPLVVRAVLRAGHLRVPLVLALRRDRRARLLRLAAAAPVITTPEHRCAAAGGVGPGATSAVPSTCTQRPFQPGRTTCPRRWSLDPVVAAALKAADDDSSESTQAEAAGHRHPGGPVGGGRHITSVVPPSTTRTAPVT
jgi:hypothetical protein